MAEPKYKPGVGVDVGTSNIAVARRCEDGSFHTRFHRDMLYPLEISDESTDLLQRSDYLYIKTESKYYIIGEDALKLVNAIGRGEVVRPMQDGLLNPSLKESSELLFYVIKAVVGDPIVKNEPLRFSVPANPIDRDQDNIFHKTVLASFFTKMGYDPKPVNEGMCFTGETKISLLDGSEVAIKDLVGKGEFWVYSCTPEGKIVPGRGHSAQLAKQTASICQVTLDNGESVKCTSDHRWMLRDGSYREAKDLKVGDSLMPLYRKVSQKEISGYELLLQPLDNKWHFTHRLFVSRPIPEGCTIVHHKNYNRFDNRPDNFQWMTSDGHLKLHREGTKKWRENPDNTSKAYAKISAKAKERWKSDLVYRNKVVSGVTAFQRSFEGRAAASRKFKQVWSELNPDYKEAKRLADKERMAARRGNPVFDTKQRVTMKVINTTKVTCDVCGKVCGNVSSLGMHKQLAHSIAGRERILLARGKKVHIPSMCDTCGKILSTRAALGMHKKFCEDSNLGMVINHKVTAVKTFDEVCDVYDITVDGYHNFALSAGVFVHNCITYDCNPVLKAKGEKDLPISGITCSCGGGMWNLCLAFKGLSLLEFSCTKSGDYVDDCVSKVTGLPRSKVTVVKERKLNLEKVDDNDRVQVALSIYYDELIDRMVHLIAKYFKDKSSELEGELELVVAGGTSMVPGFIKRLETAVRKVELPFKLYQVRHSPTPFFSVAQGACIRAQADYAKALKK